jgi:opacity protein-like surface antigen
MTHLVQFACSSGLSRLTVTLAVVSVFGVGTAHAQTPASPAEPGAGYAEVTFGPTLGHKSGRAVGVEAGYFVGDFGVFGEIGRMSDVATSDIEAKAQLIAGALNATFQAKQPATYFDGGIVKRFSTSHNVTPYALFGLGGAKVSNNVTFAIAGTDITSQLAQHGVQLGTDLSGGYTKLFVTLGAGAHVTLTSRLIADVSYRYGRIGQNAASESKAITTSRLQFGIGAKF